MRSRLLMAVWLAAVWVALWGDLTLANVLSGAVLAAVLVTVYPPPSATSHGRLRPLRALYFAGYFLAKLAEATLVVAREVLTPDNSRVREGIVAVPVAGSSKTLVVLVANAISLTPGTLTLEVHEDPTVLYVHVLHLHDVHEVRLDVLRLELHAARAFGSEAAVEAAERHYAACRDELGVEA